MDIVEITDFDSLPSVEKTVAYVINLDKRVDRWRAIQERFKDTSITLERVSAVEDTVNGHNGCGKSFLKIIAAAKAEGLENVLIFEDDNVPSDNFTSRWAATKEWLDGNTDKWEIFNGGAVFTADRNPSYCIASVLYTSSDKNIVLYNKINLMSQSNFIYINKRAYDKMLSWTWSNNSVIDCFMNCENNFETVCIYPLLGIQEISYSDTINSVRDLNNDYIFTNKILLDIYKKVKTAAYVINLDKRVDRWVEIQERFKHTSIILERVSAIEDATNGHNGCGQSFLKIIAAAKAEGLENVLIFEDDNVPLDNFTSRWAATKEWLDDNTDKWEIFNGGGQVPHDLSRYPSWKLSAIPLFTDTTLNITICKANYLIRANFMYINKKAYDKILSWTWDAHKHIDCFMNDAANFATVSIYPMLCTQVDGYSDTINSLRDINNLDNYSNNAFVEALPNFNEKVKNKTIAYVINLDKRNDRWLSIQERFKDTLIVLQRISAVEDTSNGHNGCGKSFLKIITAAKAQGLENVLIFEDDNVPLDNFTSHWAEAKDWLDTNTDQWEIFNGGPLVPDEWLKTGSQLKARSIFNNNSVNICKVNYLMATNFMYINKKAFDKILAWNWETHKYIDRYINNYNNFNVVSIYPLLCKQSDGYSSITNRNTDYKLYNTFTDKSFKKALANKITIVTAIYKIPSKQPFEFYLEKFKLFISHMPHPIVVFTTKNTYDQIQSIVEESKNFNIIIYTLEIDEFMLRKIASTEILEAHVQYTINNYIANVSSQLYTLYFQKSFFVSSVIEKNPFSSSWFIWNDCGSIRNTQWLQYVDTSYNIDSLESTEHVYLQLGFPIESSDFIRDAHGLFGKKLPYKESVCGAIILGSSNAWKEFTSKLLVYTQKIIEIHSKNTRLVDVNIPILIDESLYYGVLMNYPSVAKGIFTENSYKHMDYDRKGINNPRWFGFYCIFSSICDYKYSIMDSNKLSENSNIKYINIVASMTTLPSRIAHIKPVLECILNQTVPVKHIEINIPEKCIRTGEIYIIPIWLTCMPKVKIFRTPDYGPITKVVSTFLRAAGDTTTYIWSCDDDRLYPPNTLQSLTNGIDHFSNEARGAAPGITVCENGFTQLENYDASPSYLQGYGTILYAPNLIKDDFNLYLKFTQISKDCRFQDEPVLFNYLAKYNILLKAMNPYNINFCSKDIITEHESVPEALCRVEGGHKDRVIHILEFLRQEDLLYLQLKSKKLRLHILGIPHTVTNSNYSHCAFTGKVQRFAPMMRPLDYEVYHYGNAGSVSGATKDICILSAGELESLSIESYKYLHPTHTDAQIKEAMNNTNRIVGDLARWDTPLYKEFNRRLKIELKKFYRSKATDIVCNPYGKSYTEAFNGLDIVSVECGIGYKDPCEAWRIYESYAWFHSSMALEGHNGTYKNYWYVIPQSFNILEWPLNLNPTPKTVGFLGRIGPGKGCHIIVDIARRFPDITFILCGGGDPIPYLLLPNIQFKEQIHGSERATYLGSLVALIAPTQYVEPYGCISPEAQLCGTPVIAPDSGGFTETVIHMSTGVLCHTLADYCFGIQLALDGKFDRSYIRARAVERYDMSIVSHKWDQAFKSILDMSNGAGGWYGETSHIKVPLIFYDEYNNKLDNNLFEVTEQYQASRYIKSDSVVLELGARYGTVSCAINKCLENPYNQVSVEPDMRVWDSLEKNKKINNCKFNILKGLVSKKKMMLLSEIGDDYGYGTTSVDDIHNTSTIMHNTLSEVETMYKLKFNTLVADCEGFLEQFLDENPILYTQLSLIMFEKDYPEKCCYDKIIENLKKHGFNNIVSGFHEIWTKPTF